MKKYGIIFILILLLGTILYSYKPLLTTIGADSGWDSSYDSGGSSSSSSWSSSSHSSSSSGGGSSKNFSEMDINDFIVLELIVSIFYVCFSIFFIVELDKNKMYYGVLLGIINILRIIIAVYLETNVNYNWVAASMLGIFVIPFIGIAIFLIITHIKERIRRKQERKEIAREQEKWNKLFSSIGVDSKEVTKELYQIFVDVQNAWMNFDYDKLKELCSDELYNSYKKDLEILKLKDGQNIMDNFNPIEMYIITVTRKDNALKVEFYLDIKFRDYVINTKSNKVIRGSKYQIMHNKYWLIYQKQDFYTDKCPSCGEELPATGNTTCPSCNSIIINNTNKFVLVHKERIP